MLIVFISNACMMILELVAGRIIAPYLGVSLYTWTGVIGVVLAGMSLGNYLGGRLADRFSTLRLVGVTFLAAGLFTTGILFIHKLALLIPYTWPYVARTLILTAALFFFPSMLLGGISPMVMKLTVRDLAHTGATIGRVSAAGTLGSILGTFATGFVLISAFGTYAIVWGVAATLALMSLFLLIRPIISAPRRGMKAAITLLFLVATVGTSALAWQRGWLRGPCLSETNYYCIRITEWQQGEQLIRVLFLDNVTHSQNVIGHPEELELDYEKVLAELTAYRATQGEEIQALFLGGGGYSFPRYFQALYPHAHSDVVEIDPGVTRIAYEQMDVVAGPNLVTYNQDARLFLAGTPSTHYDLIFGDAFNNFSVPYHLVTREFNDLVKTWLTDDGLYIVNLLDSPQHDFLRAYALTLSETFAYTYIIPADKNWGELIINYILVGTDTQLDLQRLAGIEAGDGVSDLTNLMLNDDQENDLLYSDIAILLTDQHAPVDQLLAPLFHQFTSGQ